MKHPLVSIILPTYNGALIIGRSIKSILNQSFIDWELIIIDDGSGDNTQQIIIEMKNQDSRIIYLKNENNIGIQKSLNRGLKETKGKYIARIDDDDIWVDRNKLSTQVDFLEKNPQYVLVGTNAIICDYEGNELGSYKLPETDEEIRARMLLRNCFIHPSIMALKFAIEKAGGYDESEDVKHIEDYALWLKLGLVGKFANLNMQSVQLTVHQNSITFKNRIAQARRMSRVINMYRKKYPRFFIGKIILYLRIAGFFAIKLFPAPSKLVYKIQKIYKEF